MSNNRCDLCGRIVCDGHGGKVMPVKPTTPAIPDLNMSAPQEYLAGNKKISELEFKARSNPTPGLINFLIYNQALYTHVSPNWTDLTKFNQESWELAAKGVIDAFSKGKNNIKEDYLTWKSLGDTSKIELPELSVKSLISKPLPMLPAAPIHRRHGNAVIDQLLKISPAESENKNVDKIIAQTDNSRDNPPNGNIQMQEELTKTTSDEDAAIIDLSSVTSRNDIPSKYSFREIEDVCFGGAASKEKKISEVKYTFYMKPRYESYSGYTPSVITESDKSYERLVVTAFYDWEKDYWNIKSVYHKRKGYQMSDSSDNIDEVYCSQESLYREIKRICLFFCVDPNDAWDHFLRSLSFNMRTLYDEKTGDVLATQSENVEELAKKLDDATKSKSYNTYSGHNSSYNHGHHQYKSDDDDEWLSRAPKNTNTKEEEPSNWREVLKMYQASWED
jgi:hypothetical protein